MSEPAGMFDPIPSGRLNGHSAGPVWRAIIPVPDDAPRSIPRHPLGEPSAVWDYPDAASHLLGRVCRWDHGDGDKTIMPLSYCEDGTGRRSWRWLHPQAPRSLFGLDQLALRPDAPVLLVEGEKTAEAAAKLFPDYVAVTSSGGSNAAGKADWSPTAGRVVTIWGDHDEPGRGFVADVARLVREVGAASIRIVEVPGEWPQKWDLADALPEGVTVETLQEMLCAARACSMPEGSASSKGSARQKALKPRERAAHRGSNLSGFHQGSKGSESAAGWLPKTGFRVRPDGNIEYEDAAGEWQWLCSPLMVEAATRNGEGEAWGRLLRIRDRDHVWHEWAMPMAELAGAGDAYRARLLAMGLELAPGTAARNALHRLLTSANPQNRARCVAKLGWHGGVFMLPDSTIGETKGERLVLQTSGPLQHNFRQAGTSDGWRDGIGRLAVGNSRLVFAISMALAAPMLRPLAMEGGGAHFRGSSSTGKTTIAEAAGSACGGGPDGYKLTWRATDNAIETVAALHNDGFAVLDEIGQVGPEALGAVAYMLANGQAKRRMSRDASARTVPAWRLLFLSTGEIGLADKLREGKRGGRVMAGQQVRVLELPADAGAGHGVFETLHGLASGQALADHLKTIAGQHYGHPLREFLGRLVREPWQDRVRAFIDSFVSAAVSSGADGQVRRAAQRFAVIAAAGEMAQRWSIVPWPEGEATTAARRLFDEWLSARGGSEPAEIEAGLVAVRHFLEVHGASRFAPWLDPNRAVHNRAGFSRADTGETAFYVLPEAWRSEILAGHDAGMIAREMAKRGNLKATADGKPQTKQRLPDGSERKVYVVLPSIFEGCAP